MKKQIASVEMVGSNVMELQAALTKMIGAARMAHGGGFQGFGGSSTLDVEDTNGQEIAEVALIEEILSDKSKVYNVVVRFSNI